MQTALLLNHLLMTLHQQRQRHLHRFVVPLEYVTQLSGMHGFDASFEKLVCVFTTESYLIKSLKTCLRGRAAIWALARFCLVRSRASIQRCTRIPTSVACHGPSRHTHTKRTDSEASEAAVSSLVASVPMVEAECANRNFSPGGVTTIEL